jgi:hypothetical protein
VDEENIDDYQEFCLFLETDYEIRESVFGSLLKAQNFGHTLADEMGDPIIIHQRINGGWEQVDKIYPSEYSGMMSTHRKKNNSFIEEEVRDLPYDPKTCSVCSAPLEFITLDNQPLSLTCPNGHDVFTEEDNMCEMDF